MSEINAKTYAKINSWSSIEKSEIAFDSSSARIISLNIGGYILTTTDNAVAGLEKEWAETRKFQLPLDVWSKILD